MNDQSHSIFGQKFSVPVPRRNVVKYSGGLAIGGVLSLAGCASTGLPSTSRGVGGSNETNDTSLVPSISNAPSSSDDAESSHVEEGRPEPDGVAVVPLLARVMLVADTTYYDLPAWEFGVQYVHVARQLTIERYDLDGEIRYVVGPGTWGIDLDQWAEGVVVDETLYEMRELDAFGVAYIYDNCENRLVRTFEGPIGVEMEGSFEVLPSATDPEVVEFWYIPPRLTMTNPGGPRGKGACYLAGDDDEPATAEVLVPGTVGGIEDCYEESTRSGDAPRISRIRGFLAFYLFSIPWSELSPFGLVPDTTMAYECREVTSDDRYYQAATFEVTHYVELTPLD